MIHRTYRKLYIDGYTTDHVEDAVSSKFGLCVNAASWEDYWQNCKLVSSKDIKAEQQSVLWTSIDQWRERVRSTASIWGSTTRLLCEHKWIGMVFFFFLSCASVQFPFQGVVNAKNWCAGNETTWNSVISEWNGNKSCCADYSSPRSAGCFSDWYWHHLVM
jgi:hypothetical protein